MEAQLQQLYHNFEQNREEINHLSSELTRIRDDRIKGILLRAKVRWIVANSSFLEQTSLLETFCFQRKPSR